MLQTAINAATLAAILATLATNIYALWRMMQVTTEAREARAIAAVATTKTLALAERVEAKVERQSADLAELTLNTNSIREQLVESTAKASHLEGRAEVTAEVAAAAEKAKP